MVGERIHHAQIFQDRLTLVDTFSRDEDGLDVFLMDPETNEIVGGVRNEELGGASYTAFTDDEFVYILMEPGDYGPSAIAGYRVANLYNRGEYATLRPFWVAKVGPETWEVVAEYPYPGFRANWIVIDSRQEFMYIPVGANSYLNKVDLLTGEIVWTTPTGTGPYGASLKPTSPRSGSPTRARRRACSAAPSRLSTRHAAGSSKPCSRATESITCCSRRTAVRCGPRAMPTGASTSSASS